MSGFIRHHVSTLKGRLVIGATALMALIGATASTVFYDALLPHIAGEHEIDRVSSAGYAIGFVGVPAAFLEPC